jgi:rubredoxin
METAKKDEGLFTCLICGYQYDQEKGDPDLGIPAGTPVSQLPPDWHCPDCGVGLEDFEYICA